MSAQRAWSLVLMGEFGSVGGALHCPAAPGGIDECGVEFFECRGGMILLEEQTAKLFAGWEDWAGGYGEFLDRVLVVG